MILEQMKHMKTFNLFLTEEQSEDQCDLLKRSLESSSVLVEITKEGFHRSVTPVHVATQNNEKSVCLMRDLIAFQAGENYR